MKTKIKNAACIAIAGVLYMTQISAQDIAVNKKEEKKLTLNIEVSGDQSDLSEATVKVFHNKKCIATKKRSSKQNAKIALKNNSYYVIEISSPGYVTKSFLVSTVFPTDSTSTDNIKYEHTISVSLNKDIVQRDINKSSSGNLIGILFYHGKQENFLGCELTTDSPHKDELISQIEAWLE